MAIGDYHISIDNIAAGANLDIQPTTGVNCIVNCVGNRAVDVTPYHYNGTDIQMCYAGCVLRAGLGHREGSIYIDNTTYMRITNNDGATQPVFSSHYECG